MKQDILCKTRQVAICCIDPFILIQDEVSALSVARTHPHIDFHQASAADCRFLEWSGVEWVDIC